MEGERERERENERRGRERERERGEERERGGGERFLGPIFRQHSKINRCRMINLTPQGLSIYMHICPTILEQTLISPLSIIVQLTFNMLTQSTPLLQKTNR